MAERWQQWMPFHIDKFRGSPEVQAMHPAARIGYIYLLASAWQTEDCTVSADPIDLATESGLGDEMWAMYGPRILRKFEMHDGRLRNTVLFTEWNDSRERFVTNREARAEAGRMGAAKRWHSDAKELDSKSHEKPKQNMATGTGTGTGTVIKQEQADSSLFGDQSTRPVVRKTVDAESIYKAYPRKVGKPGALKAIAKAFERLTSSKGEGEYVFVAEEANTFLIYQAQQFAKSEAGQAGMYTPHPQTWFNQSRYLDDPKEWKRGGNSGKRSENVFAQALRESTHEAGGDHGGDGNTRSWMDEPTPHRR